MEGFSDSALILENMGYWKAYSTLFYAVFELIVKENLLLINP